MFTKNVRFIEIDLTNICNARCPQCPRYDLDYRLKPGLNKNSLSVEDIKYGIDQKYWLTIDNIEHSGATGEPTLNPSVLEILEYEIQKCPNAYFTIHTNGDTHNTQWWKNLGELLSRVKHEVQFGIDGLQDTHHLYRVGTNFDRVIENAKAFISGGGYAIWQFIIFKHNQHQVQDAHELAIEYGFSGFKPLRSTRFVYQKDTAPFNLGYKLEPSDLFLEENIADPTHITTGLDSLQTNIVCRSMNSSTVYIYADGTVWPCTYLGGIHVWQARSPHTAIDWSMIKKHIITPFGSLPNIKNKMLSEILNSEQWDKWTFVTNKPTLTCKQQCNVCVESREHHEYDTGYRL